MLPSNPYIAGNPVHGQDKFIGRQDVLRDVEQMLRNASTNAIVLFGQRRIGKTSVLLHIERELAAKKEFTPIYFDLQDKASLSLAKVLYQMAQKISLVVKVNLPKRKQFDQNGKFFRETFIPAAVKTSKSQGLVLLLDEFDVLDLPKHEQAGATFFPYLRDWMKIAEGIQFVFVLGRRPEELSTDTLSTFKGIRSRRVSLMTHEDSEDIIRQSEKNASLTWNDEAVERVWHWTQGHPYFTQLLCSEIWETAIEEEPENPPAVDTGNVDAAIDAALEQGANAFQWIWNGLPPAERIVMAAMAEAKEDHISQDELTDILNRSKVRLILRELELAPETLISWDLLRPVDNTFRFAIPLLRRWVAAEKPLRRVKAELDSLEPLAESLYHSGEGFYKIGNLEEAERSLRNALDVNPNHFRARLLLAQVLLGKGNPAEAVEELEPAYEFEPRSSKSRLIGALLALAETQNAHEQLGTYNKILAIEPDQAMALEKKQMLLSDLAEAALRKADFVTALKMYQEVGNQNKVNHIQKINQQLVNAQEYEKMEDWSAVIEVYEKLLTEFPDEEDWQYRLRSAQIKKELIENPERALGQEFEFDIITINDRGEEIKRSRGKARQRIEDLGGGVFLEMVYIPGGEFLMGSPKNEEGWDNRESPQHKVTVSPFFMGKYPVTQEQWETVIGSNPSHFKGPKRPVENVSWEDAVEFCKRLSQKTGRVYHLPSEAEWEYACRAGTTTPFYFGETITPELANYGEKYEGTTDVGKFSPNAFGLYDMHGNVWEWCADPWHDNYEGASSDGSVWKSGENAQYRLLRGGSWDDNSNDVRCAARGRHYPVDWDISIGFRVVLVSSSRTLL